MGTSATSRKSRPTNSSRPNSPKANGAAGAGRTAQQAAGAPDDSVAQLTQLKSLLDSGALTQEEFDAENQKIIGA